MQHVLARNLPVVYTQVFTPSVPRSARRAVLAEGSRVLVREARRREQVLRDHVVQAARDRVLIGAVAARRCPWLRAGSGLFLSNDGGCVVVREEVADEDPLVGRQLIVDARHVLLVGAVVRLRDADSGRSRPDRAPDPPAAPWSDDLQRDRMEQRRIDLVVHERRAERPRRAAAAGRRHDAPEIAAEHLRGRDHLVVGQRHDVVVRDLRAEEEEQLVRA